MFKRGATSNERSSLVANVADSLCSLRNEGISALLLQEPKLYCCAKQNRSTLPCCLVLQINPHSDDNCLTQVKAAILVWDFSHVPITAASALIWFLSSSKFLSTWECYGSLPLEAPEQNLSVLIDVCWHLQVLLHTWTLIHGAAVSQLSSLHWTLAHPSREHSSH